MKNKGGLNSILSTDRKALYIVLGIVMISVLTLTVVYAALSTTLNINGNAEVTAASWDIHLDNVQLNSSSATTTAPTITDSKTATFSTTLSKPGDFYEFTIDVVNNGSIDAMIDGVTKTPTLTEAQAKYLNYIVEYQNGESINTKQIVSKNSFVRLKVKVEFRKELVASDLPSTSETLNLAFTVNYVQADSTGTNVSNNGKVVYEIVSGDLYTVGSEICIGEECFYLMKNNGSSVTMFAKNKNSCPIDMYIPPEGSACVKNYKTDLESQGALIEEARYITFEELEALGCNISNFSCLGAPDWVSSDRNGYYIGENCSPSCTWILYDKGIFSEDYISGGWVGFRLVITLTL